MNRLSSQKRAQILTALVEGLHTTPGMEAGLADRVYKMTDLVLS